MFAPNQKIQMVLESIRANPGTAELRSKHNMPQTFRARRQKFMGAGKAGRGHYGNNYTVRAVKRESADLK